MKLRILGIACAIAFFVINIFLANKVIAILDAMFGVTYGWIVFLGYIGLIGCVIGWAIENVIEGEE